jgi:hypothetical protein
MVRDSRTADGADEAAGATRAHPLLPLARPVIAFLQQLNRMVRRVSRFTHRLQGAIEGHYDRRRMWFDHYVDINWKLPAQEDAMFLERAVFNRMLIAPGAHLLEIACGDGYYTRNFYAPLARTVVAVDVDSSAIAFARRSNHRANVRYELCDVRRGLPKGEFDHVIWDGGMLYLTLGEVDSIIGWIHDRIGPDGIFSGYTYADYVETRPYIRHRVSDGQDVADLLLPHFANVVVLSSTHPDRRNFYFAASDASLPPPAGRSELLYARRDVDRRWSVDVRSGPASPTT